MNQKSVILTNKKLVFLNEETYFAYRPNNFKI